MCEILVGLPDVLGVLDVDEVLQVHVECRDAVVGCRDCDTRAHLKDQRAVEMVDLPCLGRPTSGTGVAQALVALSETQVPATVVE